jgi:hypothetical protein
MATPTQEPEPGLSLDESIASTAQHQGVELPIDVPDLDEQLEAEVVRSLHQ